MGNPDIANSYSDKALCFKHFYRGTIAIPPRQLIHGNSPRVSHFISVGQSGSGVGSAHEAPTDRQPLTCQARAALLWAPAEGYIRGS